MPCQSKATLKLNILAFKDDRSLCPNALSVESDIETFAALRPEKQPLMVRMPCQSKATLKRQQLPRYINMMRCPNALSVESDIETKFGRRDDCSRALSECPVSRKRH